jgi:signal transduction histidine kinase
VTLSSRPGLSIRAYLATLIAVTLLPLIVVLGIGLKEALDRARERAWDTALQATVGAADSVDRDLENLIIAGSTLAVSGELERGDYAELQRQALRVRDLVHAELIVKDPSGRQLVNTRLPWGSPLPTSLRPNDVRAIETRQPVVSNIFIAAVTGAPAVDIAIPVIHHGVVTHVINLAFDPQRIVDILVAQGLPEAWTLTVIGDDDRIVARSVHPEQSIGERPSATFLHNATGDRGVYPGVTLEGTPTLSAYSRLQVANWRAAFGVPRAVVEAPFWQEARTVALAALAALAVSVAFAMWLGRSLIRGVGEIATATDRIGRAPRLALRGTAIREVNAVAVALEATSKQLHDQALALAEFNRRLEREVHDATRELAEGNERLRAEIAARESAEHDLRQAQKMEAIGQLTGGIAHDFNNMLTIILNSLRLLKRRLERGDHDVDRFADSAIQGASRAADLTARLLAYGRRQPLAPQAIDVNKTVAAMGEMLRRTIPETVEIETILAGGLWRAYADPQGVENAIINLAINARDAMPRGGKLTIETSNAHLDDGYAANHADVVAGQYVMIGLTDTGTGMAPEVLEHAFEPFFTTKGLASGSGLGLSQVYGFIKQSEGHVKIYTEIDHGTTVKIYLPRAPADAKPAPVEEPKPIPAPATHGTILVVEDDPLVRDVTVGILRELGYTTLSADGARGALALLAVHPEVALLLTDVVMPEMNGRELADEACRRRPDLKVLFTTGYTRNAIIHGGILDPGRHLVTKPHTVETLARKLDELLRP